MNIAYLSVFYPYRGGIAQFNAALFNELVKQGHTVNAFNFSRQYPSILFPGKTQQVRSDDTATAIPSLRVLDSINPLSWYRAAIQIRETKPDILLTRHWISFLAPSLGTVAARVRQTGTKVITIVDNAIPHEPKFFDRTFTKRLFKNTSAFVAMSEEVKQGILDMEPGSSVLLHPHPFYDHFGAEVNRADAHRFLQTDASKKTILFFGFIREYKGLDILIDAFGVLDDSYQLIVAGEAYGSIAHYRNQMDANPNRNRIHAHFHYISDAEVPNYFSAADVVVLPYRTATQSGITAISYHFGKPVIASSAGGLGEMVLHERTGLVIPEIDSKNLASAINTFFSVFDRQQCIAEIKALKSALSWQSFADALIKFAEAV